MNQNQKRILVAVVAVFVGMLAYPPFHAVGNNGVVFNMGYRWIFSPPKLGYITATVNDSMLLIQWICVLVIGGIVFFLTKSAALPSGSSSKHPKIIKHEEKKSELKNWGEIALVILGIIIVAGITKGLARAAVRSHGSLPILGDLIFIVLTSMAWFRGWKWLALIPAAVAYGFAIILSLSGIGIENSKGIFFVFVLLCWTVLGIMIFKEKKVGGELPTFDIPIQESQSRPERYFFIAEKAVEDNEHNTALKNYSLFIDKEATNKELLKIAHTNRGLILINSGFVKEGKEDILRAIELGSDKAKTIYDAL